ncbi:MAG: glycosyltransferase, partial [Gammaproteobacteria bacterium]|nr:glycosyltransferase [Gammaproteobacteria bacterium]
DHGVAVAYHSDPADVAGHAAGDLAIVDSLIVAEQLQQLTHLPARSILLMHMLPPQICGSAARGSTDDYTTLFTRFRVVASGALTRRSIGTVCPDDASEVVLIEPGVAANWQCRAEYSVTARNLLCIANYLPGKGHVELLETLAALAHLPWSLRLHGNTDLDPGFFAVIRQRVISNDFEDRVHVGEAIAHEAVQQAMLDADLLLQFSAHETWSMVTAEAIAGGLPTLSSRTGNWQSFEQSGLVQYFDDAAESTAALTALITDKAAYARLRRHDDWTSRTWDEVGEDFLGYLSDAT